VILSKPLARLELFGGKKGQEPLAGLSFLQTKQVDGIMRGQKSSGAAVLNLYREQRPMFVGRILLEDGSPLRLGQPILQVSIGKNLQAAGTGAQSLVERKKQVIARPDIPGLKEGEVACLLQLSANPFGPGNIVASVADEEIAALLLLFRVILAHSVSLLRHGFSVVKRCIERKYSGFRLSLQEEKDEQIFNSL
jgi:hypothetical protein